MKRSERLEIRLSEEELKIIETKSSSLGMMVSEYIRFCCINSKIRINVGKTPEQELLSELEAIDRVEKLNNLNTSPALLEQRRKDAILKYRTKTENQ